MRLVAALSGGVDSALAAALLRDQGHEVLAVHLSTGVESEQGSAAGRSCCGADDARDARAVAARLGLPFYVVDVRAEFAREVLAPFVSGYATGTTPNPCVACNRGVKFGRLLDVAASLGGAAVATGHYARLERGAGGRLHLARAADRGKDQAYVLHALDQDQLARACFPLGAWTKSDVRAEARRRGLPVAEKPDSQDLCFVPEGDVRAWLARQDPLARAPGTFVDGDGRAVGTHAGALGFTRGQRRGLPALGTPHYVTHVDPSTGRVGIGPREAVLDSRLEAGPVTWGEVAPPPPGTTFQVEVQVRHGAGAVPARLTALPAGRVEARLEQPVFGAAPGQALVAWRGEALLCGGPLSRPAVPA